MTESITFNLESFALFLKKHNFASNANLSTFGEVIRYFDNSLGGCGCNRNVRAQFANDFYENFIKSIDEQKVQHLKELSFTKKIIFLDRSGVVLREF
ncbi:MAG: hypothetical protein EBU90_13750 [Proteobacteria bacterium]|nr:hypothetical protein [Pseudomonadota bacterium]